jgi:UPF0755 protein
MNSSKLNIALAVALALILLVAIGYRGLFAAPADFVPGSVVTIASGATAPRIAQELTAARVIRHSSLLRLVLRLSGKSGSVRAGAYRFDAPQNVFTIATRLASGAYGFPPVRITFPEGTTAREMATRIASAFPDISAEAFLKEAKPYEGYLFPDTYFFPGSSSAASIVDIMRANFDAKTATLVGETRASSNTIPDIVILASLIEREARTSESKRIVAGIISNRLKLGMPLQVDAVFGYIFDRETYSPSYADLKVDSPYNTYTHTGLPPGPIANPGLDSLEAAAHPTQTDYVYYLTGTDGLMHYATTHVGHQANRKKYLD